MVENKEPGELEHRDQQAQITRDTPPRWRRRNAISRLRMRKVFQQLQRRGVLNTSMKSSSPARWNKSERRRFGRVRVDRPNSSHPRLRKPPSTASHSRRPVPTSRIRLACIAVTSVERRRPDSRETTGTPSVRLCCSSSSRSGWGAECMASRSCADGFTVTRFGRSVTSALRYRPLATCRRVFGCLDDVAEQRNVCKPGPRAGNRCDCTGDRGGAFKVDVAA